ncbi:MAG: folate-binding protein [Betaproteobacteria bacterium]
MPDAPSALPAAPAAPVVCELAPLAVLAVSGADAADFLHGQLSSDVRGLPAGRCQYTSFNSPKGRVLANFVLWRHGDGFRALLPADLAEPVRKRLAMYVLRSKVVLADASADTVRFGIGGPGAATAVAAACGEAPDAFGVKALPGGATMLGLPGPRFVVVAPAAAAGSMRDALRRHAAPAPFDVWQWLTIRAGVPVVTTATQDQFVAQAANWDLLGGVNFQKGCYTGQEIIARMQYLGRLKERTHLFHVDGAPAAAGDRLYSAAFGDQACGTVVNAAPAPAGGTDLLAVVQLAATAAGDVRLGAPDGPPLVALPLPYAIPAPVEPRGRVG